MSDDLAASIRADLDARAKARTADYLRRRRSKLDARAARKRAREFGLAARHKAKLDRAA